MIFPEKYVDLGNFEPRSAALKQAVEMIEDGKHGKP
jgi:hypothetical protein